MFQLVTYVIHAEAQSLVPEVMRCIIKYGWSMLLELEGQFNKIGWIVDIICVALRIIIRPPYNQSYRLKPSTQGQIIEVLHDLDFPDWTARILVRLEPRDSEKTEDTLMEIFDFFEELNKAIETKSELEKRFSYYIPEWWRISRYMLFTGYATFANPPAEYHDHYTLCLKTWSLVSEL